MDTGNRQSEILEKSKECLSKITAKPFISKSSVLLYLNSWDPTTLGNAYLKWRISLERSSAWFFFRICKNLFSMRNYTSMILHASTNSSGNEKYDALLVSWCKFSDFDESGLYHDRYFDSKAEKHKNVLWLLLSIDNRIPISFESNIKIYAKKDVSFLSGLLFVCKTIWEKAIALKGKLSYAIYAVSAESIFAEKITAVGNELNMKFGFRTVIMPYEAQPFQHAMFKELKQKSSNINTIGYLHSVLPPLPSDLIRREGAPDIVYVHGEGQIDIMQSLLNWQPHQLRFTPSLRFKKNIKESFSGWIFLPYDFSESKTILAGLESYLKTAKISGLPKLVIRCHPAKMNSKKHIALMNGIEIILEKYQERFHNESQKQVSIFIGATAAIIEAIERSVEVVHITSDPVFESHQENIWNDLEVIMINKNLYKYKIKTPGRYIQLGNDEQNITQMLAL